MCVSLYPFLNDFIKLRIEQSIFCSHKWAKKCNVKINYRHYSGGDEESRTPDPLLARQMLYQLSYTPTYNIDYI